MAVQVRSTVGILKEDDGNQMYEYLYRTYAKMKGVLHPCLNAVRESHSK